MTFNALCFGQKDEKIILVKLKRSEVAANDGTMKVFIASSAR